ncbi:UPF0481 protein At3g47200-like [Rhodamnia argentea]|uniref:UPF0481 protein At3g47200-like n=1 Tax=Rhodamnia argentea TaxID=178133 RepID=A0A8B8N7K6_9MYRT|nr:UPF0481 protein At3g47200-like [Rhodamnia argentea]
MDTPLLSPATETCRTSETCRTVLPLPPSQDPNETNWIVPVNAIERQYWKNPSIYRVPATITKLNPNAYRPQVVSFGPYHHNAVQLRPMEEHKNRARRHFLNRSRKTPEPFLESLREVARDLEESYDALDPKRQDGTGDHFLELMITDGCFMLEIMRIAVAVEEKKNGLAPSDPFFSNDYAPNDPIFSTHRLAYMTPYIKRDMLMLENQLPMLVLERLVAVERDGKERESYIHELILKFHHLNTCVSGTGRFLHVMDVFRKGLLTPEKDQNGPDAGGDETIRSATELVEAGIHFQASDTPSLKDVSFGGGVLRLPVIKVDDATESMFLNIMTFERLHIGAGTEVTSYVTFMDSIINNEGDVALLHTHGIIQSALGSDKAVAELFNSLCKEVTLASNNSLAAVQKKISTFCGTRWHKWRAYLTHTHFKNPWTIFSLIAAILLFAIAIIQTVYAVLAYY